MHLRQTLEYRQTIAKTVAKTLNRLDERTRHRIRAAIDNVAADPRAQHNNVRPLRGGGHRLRVGDWRVLYDLDHGARTLNVRAIKQRGGAYRP